MAPVVVAAPAVDAPPPMDFVVPDPPVWGLGVECMEVSPTSHGKCHVCKLKIPRGTMRLKYWFQKSAHRYVHSHCWNELPLATNAHSIACLKHQQELELGPDGERIRTAIRDLLDS